MREIITFSKDIVFKNNIASILSISLEHEEKVYSGEIEGEFIVLGDYKEHNDTTEIDNFKFHLPFTTILPPDIDYDTVKMDISNFTYEKVEDDVLHVDIEYVLEASPSLNDSVTDDDFWNINKLEERDNDTIVSFDDMLDSLDIDTDTDKDVINDDREKVLVETQDIVKNQYSDEIIESKKNDNIVNDDNSEYVTYHVHVYKSDEKLEDLVLKYHGNLDVVKDLNELDKLKEGDKIIIPEYQDE